MIKLSHARENDYCVVCGKKNSYGLQIKYELIEDGKISGKWVPELKHEGINGIIHGGLLATVIDEAMSRAIIAMNIHALTVELNVRFHHYVVAGEEVNILGWVVSKNKRKICTEGILLRENGEKILQANGTFLIVT